MKQHYARIIKVNRLIREDKIEYIALKCKTTHSTISKIERGIQTSVSDETLNLLYRHFNIIDCDYKVLNEIENSLEDFFNHIYYNTYELAIPLSFTLQTRFLEILGSPLNLTYIIYKIYYKICVNDLANINYYTKILDRSIDLMTNSEKSIYIDGLSLLDIKANNFASAQKRLEGLCNIFDESKIQSNISYHLSYVYQMCDNFYQSLELYKVSFKSYAEFLHVCKQQEIMHNIALLYEKMGDYNNAINIIKRNFFIIKNDNKLEKYYGKLLKSLGRIYINIAQYENAKIYLKIASDIDTDDLDVSFCYLRIYFHTKDSDNFLRTYNIIKNTMFNNEFIVDSSELLYRFFNIGFSEETLTLNETLYKKYEKSYYDDRDIIYCLLIEIYIYYGMFEKIHQLHDKEKHDSIVYKSFA